MVLSSSANVTRAMRGKPNQFSTQAFVHVLFTKERETSNTVRMSSLFNSLRFGTVFDLAFETFGNFDIFAFKTHDPPFLGLIASFTSTSRGIQATRQ